MTSTAISIQWVRSFINLAEIDLRQVLNGIIHSRQQTELTLKTLLSLSFSSFVMILNAHHYKTCPCNAQRIFQLYKLKIFC